MDARLCDQLAGLPVELQLEVAEYLNGNSDSGAFDNDEPRSRHASAYLLGLMCTSRQLRRVARPAYWSEVHIASKSRWKKLSLLLKGNRFKKTSPLLDGNLVRTLDLSLDPPTEDMGGLDSTDFEQMRTLSRIKHLRVRVGKGVRLPKTCGTRTYFEHLASLDHDWEGGICQLSIYSQIPQPINHCLQLASQFRNLQVLALDNVLDISADLAAVSMPNLQSFKLRNPVNLKFDSLSGFSFLLDCSKLKSLAILGCQFDSAFLRDVLVACKDQLVCLELGTTGREACLDRFALAKARRMGEHSLDTGWHIPLSLLDEPERIGDMAARICTKLTSLSLGGLLCLSPELLNILRDESRPKLHVLSLHDAGTQRPTRPSNDSQAGEEQAVLAKRPAGISPQELSDALISGLTVRRLELRGMGPEWDFKIHEPAQAVKDKCSELGIELIWRTL